MQSCQALLALATLRHCAPCLEAGGLKASQEEVTHFLAFVFPFFLLVFLLFLEVTHFLCSFFSKGSSARCFFGCGSPPSFFSWRGGGVPYVEIHPWLFCAVGSQEEPKHDEFENIPGPSRSAPDHRAGIPSHRSLDSWKCSAIARRRAPHAFKLCVPSTPEPHEGKLQDTHTHRGGG